MLSEEKKPKKDTYFRLSPEDRMEFELEDKEKLEKENVADKVFEGVKKRKNEGE